MTLRRLPLAVPLLTLVYALTLTSFHPLDLALGAVLAIALGPALSRMPVVTDRAAGSLTARAAGFPLFVVGLLLEVATGTWDVALRAVHLRPVERPGMVVVPIEERSGLGVAVTALAITLSPGSVLVDVDWEARVMLFHVIDADDPERVRAHVRRFYDRYQRGVFP